MGNGWRKLYILSIQYGGEGVIIAVHWHLNLYPTPVHHEEEAPPPRHQLPAAYPLLSEPGPFLLLHLRSPQWKIGLQGHRTAGHLCAAAHPQWDPASHVQQDTPDRFIPHPGFQCCPIVASHPSIVCRVFLTATYSIVIFGLMLLSLLETILVTHLLDKDQALQRELWLKEQQAICIDQQETGEPPQLILHLLVVCFSLLMCLWFQKRQGRPYAGPSAKPARVRNRATCCRRLKR